METWIIELALTFLKYGTKQLIFGAHKEGCNNHTVSSSNMCRVA
jgi:hypothetical protein